MQEESRQNKIHKQLYLIVNSRPLPLTHLERRYQPSLEYRLQGAALPICLPALVYPDEEQLASFSWC